MNHKDDKLLSDENSNKESEDTKQIIRIVAKKLESNFSNPTLRRNFTGHIYVSKDGAIGIYQLIGFRKSVS